MTFLRQFEVKHYRAGRLDEADWRKKRLADQGGGVTSARQRYGIGNHLQEGPIYSDDATRGKFEHRNRCWLNSA